jgi:hypothetical protein
LASNALQNLPELGFLLWKQTLWQPCSCLIEPLVGYGINVLVTFYGDSDHFSNESICDFLKKEMLYFFLCITTYSCMFSQNCPLWVETID